MSNIVRLDAIRSLDLASLAAAAAYVPIGTPFNHSMRIVHFVNDTNGTFMISFDGVTDNIAIVANGFTLYDFTSDEDSNEKLRCPQGTQIFIKYLVAPTSQLLSSNAFYITSMYGVGE